MHAVVELSLQLFSLICNLYHTLTEQQLFPTQGLPGKQGLVGPAGLKVKMNIKENIISM